MIVLYPSFVTIQKILIQHHLQWCYGGPSIPVGTKDHWSAQNQMLTVLCSCHEIFSLWMSISQPEGWFGSLISDSAWCSIPGEQFSVSS